MYSGHKNSMSNEIRDPVAMETKDEVQIRHLVRAESSQGHLVFALHKCTYRMLNASIATSQSLFSITHFKHFLHLFKVTGSKFPWFLCINATLEHSNDQTKIFFQKTLWHVATMIFSIVYANFRINRTMHRRELSAPRRPLKPKTESGEKWNLRFWYLSNLHQIFVFGQKPNFRTVYDKICPQSSFSRSYVGFPVCYVH